MPKLGVKCVKLAPTPKISTTMLHDCAFFVQPRDYAANKNGKVRAYVMMVMMTAPMTLMRTTMVTLMMTTMVMLTRMVTMGHATCQPGCHQSWHVSKLAWHWFPIAGAIIIIIEITWSNITTVYISDVTKFVLWMMYSYSKRYFFLQNQVHGSGNNWQGSRARNI